MRSHRSLLRPILFLPLVVLAFPATTALAYDIGHHQDITTAALDQENYSKDAARMVAEGNLQTDIAVNLIARTPQGQLTRSHDFLQRLHFDDRYQYSRHRALWDELDGRINQLATLQCRTTDEIYTFAGAVGMLLHSAEDYHAHSNHAEMVFRTLEANNRPQRQVSYKDVHVQDDLAVLKALWQLDILHDEGESLMSGQYFSAIIPDIFDTQGNPIQLLHDTLNKDSAGNSSSKGAYVYFDELDREKMHQLSLGNAVREDRRVIGLIEQANPACAGRLKNYRMGYRERLFGFGIKIRNIVFGFVTGHWRSGNNVIVGDGMEVTIETATGYPDQVAPNGGFSYGIRNLGKEPIRELTWYGAPILNVDDPQVEDGWRAYMVQDEMVLEALPGFELQPGQSLKVTVAAGHHAIPGIVVVESDQGRSVEIIGPVMPGYLDAAMARAIAFWDDRPEQEVFDELGILPQFSQTPF